ncbi:tryptophan synthase subunit alpha [bacterium]|nr:tryptophan synthase subunit alpha [bacterium]MBU4561681.1 tryptophan synthase subunit alpha [bacterium]
MNRIEAKFKELKKRKKTALIPFITAGDPNLKTTKELVLEMERRGADIIELGVPFSDPIADGPTIQKADIRSLKHKTSLNDTLKLVKDLRKKTEVPIVLMTYYNLLHNYGIERFVTQARRSGVDGVIAADLPIEEASELKKYARRSNLNTIFLASPTSSPERLKLIAKETRGFIYYVSLTGVTGTREELAEGLVSSLRRLKRLTKVPIAVGFGISKPEHIRKIRRYANGVVVGSAIVSVIEKNPESKDLVKKVGDFVERLAQACY